MKLYTLDNKLLCEGPEIRIGDKVYPIDDRQKTVEKVMALQKKMQDENQQNISELMKEAFKLVFELKAAKEIDEMNMHFPAYQKLFEIVMGAITGQEPEKMAERFPESTEKPEQ
jgi:hypothetical protein